LRQISKVSIVIVFYNEYPSMLKRTLHSIYNRTPRSLLHEIILVNDKSTMPELYEPLAEYASEHFGDLVKFRTSSSRRGVAVAKMEGARVAKGDVLVKLH
jgi:polypeptide N-acetylgalactosaminyltransferase